MTEKLTKIMFAMPKQQPLIPQEKENGYRTHQQYHKQSRMYNIKLKVPSISQCSTIHSQFIPAVRGMLHTSSKVNDNRSLKRRE